MHREALAAQRAFWNCLLHSSIKFMMLTKAVTRMDKANKRADQVYRQVGGWGFTMLTKAITCMDKAIKRAVQVYWRVGSLTAPTWSWPGVL